MLGSSKSNLRHRASSALTESPSDAPTVISSLIDSIPAIATSPGVQFDGLVSLEPCSTSTESGSGDYIYFNNKYNKLDNSGDEVNEDNKLCAVAQSPTVPISKSLLGSPDASTQHWHRVDKDAIHKNLPSAAKTNLLRSRDTSNRHSTGLLKLEKHTSVLSEGTLGSRNGSFGSSRSSYIIGGSCQQSGLYGSGNQEGTGFSGKPGNLSARRSMGSPEGENNYSTVGTMNSDICDSGSKSCRGNELGAYKLNRNLSSSNALKVICERSSISAEIIPDRRSSLRHQCEEPEESHLRRSSQISVEAEQRACIDSSTNLSGEKSKPCESRVEDRGEKVEKRILQLKERKKQKNDDRAFVKAEKAVPDNNIQSCLTSSQTIIVAEDHDRINRAYKQLGLSATQRDSPMDFSDDISNRQYIANLVDPTTKLPVFTDTTSEMSFLKEALDAIDASPNLSLDTLRFGRYADEHVAPIVSKRQSIKKSIRSQPWLYKDRRKSAANNDNQSGPCHIPKRLSQPVIEVGGATDQLCLQKAPEKEIEHRIQSFLTATRLTQNVSHPTTGRKISFSEVGDPKGHVVFCCVGMGLTRFVTAFYDDLARTLQLRLITPDRPGVGESERSRNDDGTPLHWPEDVLAICSSLKIDQFSVLAHSAGAIYALATALCVPQYIKCRLHLLAPWITPSQLTEANPALNTRQTGHLPRSQRILKVLPIPILRVANASFMSATSSSIARNASPSRSHSTQQNNKKEEEEEEEARGSNNAISTLDISNGYRDSILLMDRIRPFAHNSSTSITVNQSAFGHPKESDWDGANGRYQYQYNSQLTQAIWDAATANANPAVDLFVCLERHRTVGFRYTDVNMPIVIHHGSKDTRVPLQNVKSLSSRIPKCELRILDGEGHGLMASAKIMGEVLTDIAKEWKDQSSR